LNLQSALVFTGALVTMLGLTGVVVELMTRSYNKVGLTTTLPGMRPGESNQDMQERAMQGDANLLGLIRRRRPILFIVIAIGIAMIIGGALV
jgi:hypothetical protein